MNFNVIVNELRQASLFDLFRLQAAIDLQLEDPQRIDPIRKKLCPGMTISYFEKAGNRLVPATVQEMRRTRLVVRNVGDGTEWLIPFCAVNFDGVETDLNPPPGRKAPDRATLKVGDSVAFRNRQGREIYGKVTALNLKTATIWTSDRQKWRVAYSLLFLVIDSQDGKTTVEMIPSLPPGT